MQYENNSAPIGIRVYMESINLNSVDLGTIQQG